MAEKIYRIAYFTVDWNYELVENTLHGLKQYVDEHRNIRLRIFDCFGKDLDNAKDRSEYTIFSLPDLSKFDGAILLSNQIILRRVREQLIRRINESGIPAVTVGCPLPGCVLVAHDNRAAQREIANHVIREHNARRLVYLTGIINNDSPEAQQRLDGFLDACRENRLPPENFRVLNKTWRTSDGLETARTYVKEGRALPDAFICANDEMALGMINGLQEYGIHVPDDVIVTGYDNLESGQLSFPRLSSVSCDYHKLNYQAMDVLMGMLQGKETPPVVNVNYDLVFSESCGCRDAARPGLIRDRYFRQTRFLRSFYTLQDQLAEELFEANNLVDLTNAVLHNRAIFGCNDIFLCFNDYYYDNYEKNEWTQNSESYGRYMVLANRNFMRFPTHQLLPESCLSKERFLIIYPLHYNTYSIGYIALDGISEAAKMNLHESIFSFLEIAIENIRKKELLRRFNEMLDDLYVHDGLTGLYNRFGYERFAPELRERLLKEYGSIQVLFMDVDDMKEINDSFGHDLGDTALRAMARLLKSNCEEGTFIMRYGGDEFVIISSGKPADLKDRILSAVDDYNRSSGMPFQLNISIGLVRTTARENRSLGDCVREADSRMYQIKTAKKVGR
ncbi:MAG: GGDEF domain-containing protein [Clostridia bacterium]|nr:GGDEF domain-containing protein [Clostridia bacterium]